LNNQTSLFKINSFNFKIIHLFVIGILVLAFSLSFLIRSQPAEYGFELNEFDPFFNFRATEYIVENGFVEYFEWNDDKSWYPHGRDVSATSQVMLHSTAAITYQIFGTNLSVYDFTILFPTIIGSLTVIVIFALVRLFAGTTAGLFASLLFAISLPIIIRGSIGWFKSEPLGIFYGLLGLYLFLSAINSKNNKIIISKIIFGGIFLGFGMSSWGGDQFFLIPLGLFILALPFVRKDHKFLLYTIPLFVATFLLTAILFERPGPNFVFGLGGISLILPTIFLVICIFIQKISKDENKIRNGLFLLLSLVIIVSFLVITSDTTEHSYYAISPNNPLGNNGEAVGIELTTGAVSIGSNVKEIQCFCISFADPDINGNVYARIWDSNMNVLAEGSLPYSEFSTSWQKYIFTLNNSVELKSDYIIGIDVSELTGSATWVLGVGNTAGSHPIGTTTTFITNDEKIRNHQNQLQLIFDSNSSIIIPDSSTLPLPSYRYLNALNPFLSSSNPLVDSVAEHATPTIAQSYLFHSVLLIFAGLGAWFILSKKSFQSKIIIKNDSKIFILILGITGIYVSSSFIRLEVFASISLIVLASIALSILTKEIFKISLSKKKSYSLKISYVLIIFILFTIPLFVPANSNWVNVVDIPPTILNGATNHPASNDWLDALEWIKLNTPENAVVASWWDYGYWIQSLSERATLADNSTLHSYIIQNIARMLLSTPDEGWNMLQDMNADYVVVFVAGDRIDAKYDNEQLYYLAHGGDESKTPWFVRIAEFPEPKYFENNTLLLNNYFWNETLLGKMIPYSTATYYSPEIQKDSTTYQPGFIPLSVKEIKYDNSETDPLWLVYASPSFYDQNPGPVSGVFVYEINKNYVPIEPLS
jgi:asparagine N-glycosylation enzyme membrane subunit Stt3